VSDHSRRAAESADAVARAAEVRRQVEGWLTSARVTIEEGGPQFQGIDGRTASGEDDDVVSVLTTGETPLGSGDVIVTLRIDRDSATAERGLVAEFRDWRGQRRAALELEPHATALDARYRSALAEHGVWLPSWVSSSVLPRGIELRIEGDSVPPLLRLPVVAVMGGGG
jgi:hypothetical protein